MQTRSESLPLRGVIDAIPVGLAVVDVDGRMLLANRCLQRQFGYAEQELLGQPAAMLLPERFEGSHPLQVCSAAETAQGRPAQPLTDLFGRRKDGTEFPLEIGLNTIETPAGSLLIAAFSDSTVRKRLEHNFSQIIEASPVGKLVVDSDGLIQLANARLCRLFGYSREELLGQRLEMLVPSAARHAHAAQRAAFIEHPHTRAMGAGLDLYGLRSDGSEIAVEVGLSPIQTDSGIAIVAAVADVSERKRMEQHLRKLNADLDEFTYIASHDLHAPLQGIASLAEWIAEDLAEGSHKEVHRNLARIGVRIRRMECLIDDLLLYARAGRAPSAFEEVELEALLGEVVAFVEAPQTFEISFQAPSGNVTTPRVPLETVLRNLISNAIQHHDRERGRISIDVQQRGHVLSISVTDDGPGIPLEAQQRVFQLFRGLGGTSEDHSGVGLAVSKRLVESYGGRLEVVSDDRRRGTTFRFDWPCEPRRADDAT
jgi:PAS domain S-box-containing protein